MICTRASNITVQEMRVLAASRMRCSAPLLPLSSIRRVWTIFKLWIHFEVVMQSETVQSRHLRGRATLKTHSRSEPGNGRRL
jgi:hypothetical protein